MVDSSVGGKTGFDFALGKNLIGAFHQPSHVVIDTAHVETLALREWVAGFGEVVKAAALAGEEFFGWLESHAAELVAVPHRLHGELVRRAVSQKIDVVVADEEESGVRAVLNLGHTFGHALESHGGFSRWLHGEAVSIGMVTELRAAAELGFASREVADRLERLLRRLGLPTTVPSEDVHAALLHIGRDKKRQGSFVRWPVLRAVGDAQLVDVELQRLETALQSLP
jgi:3-dehydroquinate synthetase